MVKNEGQGKKEGTVKRCVCVVDCSVSCNCALRSHITVLLDNPFRRRKGNCLPAFVSYLSKVSPMEVSSPSLWIEKSFS